VTRVAGDYWQVNMKVNVETGPSPACGFEGPAEDALQLVSIKIIGECNTDRSPSHLDLYSLVSAETTAVNLVHFFLD
jgi:hypothetical protein